jgi:hypothetical protein
MPIIPYDELAKKVRSNWSPDTVELHKKISEKFENEVDTFIESKVPQSEYSTSHDGCVERFCGKLKNNGN